MAQESINHKLPPPYRAKRPVVYTLARIAGEPYGVLPTEILGPGRQRWLAQTRWAIMLTLREVRGWSLPHIGYVVGGRDHTTVMHGLKQGAALRDRSERFAALCAKLAEAAA